MEFQHLTQKRIYITANVMMKKFLNNEDKFFNLIKMENIEEDDKRLVDDIDDEETKTNKFMDTMMWIKDNIIYILLIIIGILILVIVIL